MNLKITKLTNSELESINGGKTKIKIKEKHYGEDSLSAFSRLSVTCPEAGLFGGIFLILFGAIVFGVSAHNLSNND